MGEGASQVVLVVESPAATAGNIRDMGLSPELEDPWVGKEMALTPVFLPRESHEQRSLGDYSPKGLKKLDTTEAT